MFVRKTDTALRTCRGASYARTNTLEPVEKEEKNSDLLNNSVGERWHDGAGEDGGK